MIDEVGLLMGWELWWLSYSSDIYVAQTPSFQLDITSHLSAPLESHTPQFPGHWYLLSAVTKDPWTKDRLKTSIKTGKPYLCGHILKNYIYVQPLVEQCASLLLKKINKPGFVTLYILLYWPINHHLLCSHMINPIESNQQWHVRYSHIAIIC